MLESTLGLAPVEEDLEMFSKVLKKAVLACNLLLCVFLATAGAHSQTPSTPKYKSQELSEDDGVPVLIKHLPDWEAHKNTTVFATRPGELQVALGERPVLDQIDFAAGTEAVAAQYDAGKLVIVEYTSPQGSADADERFTQAISGDGSTFYRRIGNYNVLVLDVTDAAAANALLDEVKYEKSVQWLGNNPFRISAERAFVLTTSDIFVSTVLVIVLGIGVALVGGLIAGFVYFQFRERRRSGMPTFTDAGGMTRLNLDGFTPEIITSGRWLTK